MKTNIKYGGSRFMAQVLIVLLVVALLTGATYAWQSFDQPKTNEFSGKGSAYDVTLVEKFDPDAATDWEEGEDVDKTAYVKNMGEAPIYVRLTLKEYMEIAPIAYEYSEQRYAVYSDTTYGSVGEFLCGNTYDDAILRRNHYGFTGEPVLLTDVFTGKSGYYVPTDWDDVNGQYGKKMVTAINNGSVIPVIPGTLKGDGSGFTADNGNENEYNWPKYAWDGSSNEVLREYITLNLHHVVAYSAWNSAMDPCWVYYDDNPEYIYWSKALLAGEQTDLIIDGVTLAKRPGGSFYYANRFDLEAVSANELVRWEFTDFLEEIYGLELA